MTSTTTTIRKSYGNRRLFAFPEDYPFRLNKQKSNTPLPKKNEEVAKLIKYIDDNIVGKNNAFLGPFGRRKGERNICLIFDLRKFVKIPIFLVKVIIFSKEKCIKVMGTQKLIKAHVF